MKKIFLPILAVAALAACAPTAKTSTATTTPTATTPEPATQPAVPLWEQQADAFLKAYLASPELLPPQDACEAELRLHHELLMHHTRRPVSDPSGSMSKAV